MNYKVYVGPLPPDTANVGDRWRDIDTGHSYLCIVTDIGLQWKPINETSEQQKHLDIVMEQKRLEMAVEQPRERARDPNFEPAQSVESRTKKQRRLEYEAVGNLKEFGQPRLHHIMVDFLKRTGFSDLANQYEELTHD